MNFICALLAEASPIIDHLGLERQRLSSPFALFQNLNHTLVVSGVGKGKMSTAVGFLHGIAPEKNIPWLNVGIAGHGSAQVGSLLRVSKCIDLATRRSFYSPQVAHCKTTKTILHTCDQPSSNYPENVAYYMEGSSFFETASRFSPREMVESVKIVSDNPESPLSGFEKSKVSSLVSKVILQIEPLILELDSMKRDLTPPEVLDRAFKEISANHRLSSTQVHQVQKFIRQAHVLQCPIPEILALFKESSNVKSVLSKIDQLLEERRLFS